MTAIIMIFLLLAAGVLQSMAPAAVWLASSKTPLLLGVTVYYALTHSRGVTVTVAVLAGVIQDSLSLIPVGYSSFCFAGFAFVLHHWRGVMFRDSVVTVAAVGAALGALMTLALYIMLLLGTETLSVPGWWLALKMAGSGLLGLLAVPAVWAAAGWIERHAGIEPPGDE